MIREQGRGCTNTTVFSQICVNASKQCSKVLYLKSGLSVAFCDGLQNKELNSNLLKSNCLITSQPDWGSVKITYQGPQINREKLLRYLISFRNHNEFHEQCVERIFTDIMKYCKPSQLTVYARYTRRGGLDINPYRTNQGKTPSNNDRLARQ